jgi:oxygen-dependent protoporphyrinogen oxidase
VEAKRIAVIGGGITGLAAAHRITELAPGAQLRLFEASGRLGGILQTVRQDGFLIEKSADSFITNTPWAIELCKRIGFADQLIPTNPANRGAMVVARGKLEPVPAGFVLMTPSRAWPILQSPILSTRGKLRILFERWIPSREDRSDESVADFARRRLGREAFERLVQPLVGGIYTGDPEQLSMDASLPRFVEMERRYGSLTRAIKRQNSDVEAQDDGVSDAAESGARYSLFMAPRNGMSSLVETLVARLPRECVQLNSAVARIDRIDCRWRIYGATATTGEQPEFDVVIIALPAPVASNLLNGVDATLGRLLGEIEHAGSAIVVLGYNREQITHPLDTFGFVVPAVERRRILSGSFSSVKFPGRAPEGKVLIRVFIGGALQSELLDKSDDELREIAVTELRGLLGISGEQCLAMVFRWSAAMPQYHYGHVWHVRAIRQQLAGLPGLALAGNAFEGVGIPQCIRSGEEAAETILRSC